MIPQALDIFGYIWMAQPLEALPSLLFQLFHPASSSRSLVLSRDFGQEEIDLSEHPTEFF